MTHTLGLIRVAPVSVYAGEDINIDAGTAGFICTCGKRGDVEAEENAFRLVAAWNAFEGVETSDIPRLAAIIRGMQP
ncbi:hypothetical protein [Hydrogenophaga sp.]|uniref:hypothetical protein n=1 Tax=Hydrogenophaga sp. TaxID=1904254 RepID=UPI003D135AA5